MHCLHSTSRVLMLYLGMIIHSSVGVGSIGSWVMCMGFTNRNHFTKGCSRVSEYHYLHCKVYFDKVLILLESDRSDAL